MQRCGPSGMFLCSACFGMFDFGMFNYFLLSACCIPHTHTLPARCWSCSWSRDAVLPACFFFPRSSACLILACLSLVICMQRCGPSGMFLCSACFGMFDFGMFNYFLLSACCIPHTHTLPARCWSCSWSRDAVLPACFFVPRASACLILACLITFFCRPAAFHTHTHTSGQVLVLLVVERQGSTALQQRCATQT